MAQNETSPAGQTPGLAKTVPCLDTKSYTEAQSKKQAENYTRPRAEPKKQALRSRFRRQYAIMRRLRDLGINADGISLSDGPPLDTIYAQVAGINIIVDIADASDDFAWLAGRDVFIVRERQGRIFEPGPDDPSDAFVVIPLRLSAEIALAAGDISCGLRPERRRKSPARKAVL